MINELLEKELEKARKELADAQAYGARLFLGRAPQCKALPDVLGVLTQLDNLMTGLVDKQQLADALARERQLREMLSWLHTGSICADPATAQPASCQICAVLSTPTPRVFTQEEVKPFIDYLNMHQPHDAWCHIGIGPDRPCNCTLSKLQNHARQLGMMEDSK